MRKPLNILLVIPAMDLGGSETYVSELAKGLQGRGHNVILASRGGRMADVLAKHYSVKHHKLYVRFNLTAAALMLARIIKSERVDIVHANLNNAAEVTARAAARAGTPWVMTVHMPFGRKPRYQCLRQADRVICICDFIKRLLTVETDLRPEQLVTVRSGIDLRRFSPLGDHDSAREAVGIPGDGFAIGVVARINYMESKGHLDLLRVLSEFEFAKEWQLVVAGDGKAFAKLRRTVSGMGLSDRVRLLGHVADVRPVLEAVDAVALPSLAEVLPLSLAEVAAMSKPVVAYDVGGTSEVVEDGGTGFIVPVGDYRALAERLNRLAENRKLASAMGRAGREKIVGAYDGRAMAERIERLYEEILAEHSIGVLAR